MQVRKLCQAIAFLSPAVCMTLSSVDLGLPPWEVVGILTGGQALSSFALSGAEQFKNGYLVLEDSHKSYVVYNYEYNLDLHRTLLYTPRYVTRICN